MASAVPEPAHTHHRCQCDVLEDPHNVGAILRSAEVFGFTSVCLPKKGVPEIYPSVVKVSTGATEFMKICRSHSANNYALQAAESGYRIVALDMAGKVSLRDVAKSNYDRLVLVVGVCAGPLLDPRRVGRRGSASGLGEYETCIGCRGKTE